MIKLVHVRGMLTPTGNFQPTTLSKLSKALEGASLAEFTGFREISDKGKIEFDRSYSYTSLTPNLPELVLRLQRLLRTKDIKDLKLYGTLMVIMETNDDFPKLYRVTVENGSVTCKEGSVTWQNKAA